jgi:cytidylate kinase
MRTLSPPSLERMVSRQVHRWILQEEHRHATQRPACVALSRLPGSGAAELGRRVADDLGFGFFGIELVDQIARESHVHPHLVAGLDERVRDAIERFVRDGLHDRPYQESQYHDALMRVLGTFAKRGMAVLLGRGAAYALPRERTLCVLVVSSERDRLARLRAAKGLDEANARRQLIDEEAQRKRFIRHHFAVDPDDPMLYDLVVNTETLGIRAAASLVSQAFQERFQNPRPSHRGAQPGASPGSVVHGAAAT